jgi:antiviral helicase SLH1
VTIRVVSDRWIGAEDEMQLPLASLIMPLSSQSHTPLLPLPLLPSSIIGDSVLRALISQQTPTFGAIQTQAYWILLETHHHSLLSAPGGSGKSMMARVVSL